jgi:hypothetical protein
MNKMKIMKIINFLTKQSKTGLILILINFSIMFVSCDKLPDEQFEKQVIMTRNGFVDRIIDSTGVTPLSVSISGTSILDKDLTVKIDVDTTALRLYNFDKFRFDLPLYYQTLPDSCYDLSNKTIIISKGNEYGTLPIKLNVGKIDKFKQYVLPLSVSSTSDYVIGQTDYKTILMHILLQNKFSGRYAMSGILHNTKEGDHSISMTRRLYMLDSKNCYFYAGNVDDENINRTDYIVKMTLNNDKTISLSASNADIYFKPDASAVSPKKTNVYEIMTEGSYKFYVSYGYADISVKGFPVAYTFRGELTFDMK